MPQCQAFGCKNLRGCLNEKGEKITCFAIPDPAKSKESYEQCRMWIRAIGTDKFNHKKYKYHRDRVVCEQHFTSECFLDDMKARIMGTKPRKRLKPGSVPTIFSFGPNLEPKLPSRSELRIQAKERRELLESLVPTKKPKKGTKVKSAPVDPVEIPEIEIVVCATQWVNDDDDDDIQIVDGLGESRRVNDDTDFQVGDGLGESRRVNDDTDFQVGAEIGEKRRIVRRYTRFVRDVGIQATPPQATRSIQASCNTVPPPPPGPEHDYIGAPKNIPIGDVPAELPVTDTEGSGITSPPGSPPDAIPNQILDLESLLGRPLEPNTYLKEN
ncbi:uncharacterized protein [Apostichopus japonicus]|uniref:uncharacterized protein isoform X1 n=1 Tax=Stichopus japonicus TaxID=307972 RepID=UPI003AB795BE